jgi:hypothetical protein
MVIGFVKGSEGLITTTDLSGPSSDIQYAYGKGFRIRFGQSNPHLNTSLYPPSDSLVQVEETEMETGYPTQGVTWDCSYRFKIVRNADRYLPSYRANHFGFINGECPTAPVDSEYCASPIDNRFGINPAYFGLNGQCPPIRPKLRGPHCEEQYNATCPSEPYAANLSHTNALNRDEGVYHPGHLERPAILHALRRFLPANQWDINISRRCIVPKVDDNSCYQSPPIVYDDFFFPAAQADPNMGQYTGCGVNGQYQCAAYLTLCVRR